jgi:hypothetical protein
MWGDQQDHAKTKFFLNLNSDLSCVVDLLLMLKLAWKYLPKKKKKKPPSFFCTWVWVFSCVTNLLLALKLARMYLNYIFLKTKKHFELEFGFVMPHWHTLGATTSSNVLVEKKNHFELKLGFVMRYWPTLSVKTSLEVSAKNKQNKKKILNLSLGLACTTELFLTLRVF